jgi:glycosyltransferase involved in cell wall biosynthesis
MRIGLDLRMLGGGSGVSRYVQELTTQILTIDKRNTYVLFFKEITAELDNIFRPFGHEMVATGIGHYSLAEQLRLPFLLSGYKLDLMHFPHFNVPLLYRGQFVVTIHDLTHTRFPGRKKSHLVHRLAYNLILTMAIRRAKKIIAVSNATKTEILEHFVDVAKKITTIYEGVSSDYKMLHKDEAFAEVSKKFNITKPFLLYVGVWRRYKNLPMLAQAFDKLSETFDYQLVLAGEPDPFYPDIKEQVFSIKHKDRLRAVGRVSDKDLNLLYNAADLMILPSLYEGFGLTVLEAASAGTPVVCSDIPALREVMGQAAEYFDPNNLDNMTDVISQILEKPTRLEELANLGLRRVTHFSWKKAAEETINVYQNA